MTDELIGNKMRHLAKALIQIPKENDKDYKDIIEYDRSILQQMWDLVH
jgi:hypothetical protein